MTVSRLHPDAVPPTTLLPPVEAVDALDAERLVDFLTHAGAVVERARARLALAGLSRSRAVPVQGRLLDAKEVADVLGVSKDYVYREAKRWPFTRRVGRATRFDPAGFARWQAVRRPSV